MSCKFAWPPALRLIILAIQVYQKIILFTGLGLLGTGIAAIPKQQYS